MMALQQMLVLSLVAGLLGALRAQAAAVSAMDGQSGRIVGADTWKIDGAMHWGRMHRGAPRTTQQLEDGASEEVAGVDQQPASREEHSSAGVISEAVAESAHVDESAPVPDDNSQHR